MYDKNGNLIRTTTYDAEGIKRWVYEYENDENGNVIKEVIWSYLNDESGKIVSNKQYRHEYDSFGNRTNYIEYGSNGSIYLQEEWKYDENGNEIEYIKYTNGIMREKIEYITINVNIIPEPLDCIGQFIDP